MAVCNTKVPSTKSSPVQRPETVRDIQQNWRCTVEYDNWEIKYHCYNRRCKHLLCQQVSSSLQKRKWKAPFVCEGREFEVVYRGGQKDQIDSVSEKTFGHSHRFPSVRLTNPVDSGRGISTSSPVSTGLRTTFTFFPLRTLHLDLGHSPQPPSTKPSLVGFGRWVVRGTSLKIKIEGILRSPGRRGSRVRGWQRVETQVT